MGADKSAENTYPKCPKDFRPNLSAQAQKFEIFENKLCLGVRSPWIICTLLKGQIISKQILKFSFEPKIERKYFSISALGL